MNIGDRVRIVRDTTHREHNGREGTLVWKGEAYDWLLDSDDGTLIKYPVDEKEIELIGGIGVDRNTFLDAVEQVIDDQGNEGFSDTDAMVRIMRLIVRERRKRR